MASPLQPEVPGAALAAPGRSTTVESNHASPPYQSGAFPAGPSSMFPRSSGSASAVSERGNPEAGRFRDRVEATGSPPFEASPGNRTLLAGFTPRGLASSRATQSRREDSNPRTPTVGAWCSPLSYGERETPSTGVEPASPGRQPGRVSRRVRGRAVTQYPERESNPRFRCERPASSTARRSGQDRCEAATAGVEPAFAG